MMITLTVVLTVVGLFLQLLNTPAAKGRRGENAVKSAFSRNPNSENYVIHDVTLPSKKGTTQIDHIFISKFGVFCIETKHMSGWIFGDPKQRSWTQVIYKKKTQFQNPLRQNYKHTETLRTLLNLPKDQVHSCIAFTGKATFKTPMPDNVGSLRECMAYINRFKIPVFSKGEVDYIYETIQSGRLEQTQATRRLHVQHLKQSHHSKTLQNTEFREHPYCPIELNDESSPPICPKCGKNMILRKAKKGTSVGKQFWGCSAFPKCRYIKKFEE